MAAGGVFGYLTDYLLWWVLYLSLLVHTWCFFRFFPRKRLVKSGLIVGNGLVFACLLGFVALAAESYFRFVCVETDAFGMSLPARRWFVLNTRLNSLGCRDKEWTMEKPPGVRRIAFVGDSFTYGWGIEHVQDRFPDRIQVMFDGRSPRSVEVMNVAKPGWDTGAQIQPIKDMIDVYGVDEIVLCYVPNDIEKLLPRSADFDPIRPPEPRLFNPSASCLVDYLFHRIAVRRAPTVRGYHDWLADGFADPDILQRHLRQIREIILSCRSRGVILRAVLLPYIRIGGDRFQPASVHAELRRYLEANGVDVVDLLPVIADHDPKELVVSGHDTHPNEKAHALFANAIWRDFYAGGSR